MSKIMIDTGIPEKTIEQLKNVFTKKENIDRAIVFGSRAKGNYKNGSDIDIALDGDLSYSDWVQSMKHVDDLNLPYKIDLVLLESLHNKELVNHIKTEGVLLYQKK